MKKYSIIIFAVSALAFGACTEDLNEPSVNPTDGDLTTIEAPIDVPTATKTYMGAWDGGLLGGAGAYPVLWSSGDKIALLSETGVSKFTIKGVDGTTGPGFTVAKFEGSASQVVGEFPNTLVYPAAYPADGAFAELSSGSLWVGTELPQVQTYMGGTNAAKGFADNVYPMAAASTDPAHYTFYNMAGIVRIKIYSSADEDQRISRITLRSNSGEKVSGKVAMQFDPETGAFVAGADKDNGKTVKSYPDGYESAIIDLSDIVNPTDEYPDGDPNITGLWLPKTETEALVFNIAVIPQMFPEGFTVEIQDAVNMGTSKWEAQDNITIVRSEIKEMTAINYEQPEALEIANCFQLSEAGEYILPAYAYGNRMDIRIGLKGGAGTEVEPDFDFEHLDAAVYWTDIVDENGNKIDALTNLRYLKFANGVNYMAFNINNEPNTGEPYRGNVVIALYNTETKKIFWSWHMWLTDTPKDVLIDGACASGAYDGVYPDGTPLHYEADATSGKMLIMDRNLGALYSTPEECDEVDGVVQSWQTYGLYYQDGRKDPFIGGYYNGQIGDHNYYWNDAVIDNMHKFESTAFDRSDTGGTHKTWTNPMFKDWRVTSGNLTLTNAIRDPHNYSFDKTGTKQWTNCNDADNQSWMTKSQYPRVSTHGETGLTFGGHEAYWNRTKTIMDPCPPGYSVLGERGGYFFGGNGTKEWRAADSGEKPGYGFMYTYSYNGTENKHWWPAAGVRTSDGLMAGVGEFGLYFFYDHISADHGGHGVVFHVNGVGSGGFDTESKKDAVISNHATPIRCVKDKQGEYASTGGKKKAPQRLSVAK